MRVCFVKSLVSCGCWVGKAQGRELKGEEV